MLQLRPSVCRLAGNGPNRSVQGGSCAGLRGKEGSAGVIRSTACCVQGRSVSGIWVSRGSGGAGRTSQYPNRTLTSVSESDFGVEPNPVLVQFQRWRLNRFNKNRIQLYSEVLIHTRPEPLQNWSEV